MFPKIDPDFTNAAICQRSLKAFIRSAWEFVDPSPFVENWHVDAIAEHLQAVSSGDISRLIINIPPGSAKSLICSVLWPAWVWTSRPSWQLLSASYEVGLSTRDAVKARDLMNSPWYVAHFRDPTSRLAAGGAGWEFKGDQDLKTYYKNTAKGLRQSLGVGGKGTGYRGDTLLIDDPISVQDAFSKVKRDSCIRWKDQTMASRFNDKAKATEVLIMQRTHHEDLSGHLLKQGGWEHLCIPARHERKRTCHTSLPYVDPRKEEGESFFLKLFPGPVLDRLKVETGSYGFSGQYQQSPAPQEGGIIKRAWFNRRWYLPGEMPITGLECRPVPTQFDYVSIFSDCAFKNLEDSDKVAIGVVGVRGPDVYMLQLKWERLSFTETVAALVDLKAKWPMVAGIYIEDKANGTAVMNVLSDKLPGLIPIEPDGGKEARVAACTPFIEAGNFWLPLNAKWNDDYIEEAVSFPKAPHDDAIDMTAYALNKYCAGRGSNVLAAIEQAMRG